jgi:hypothetical protein
LLAAEGEGEEDILTPQDLVDLGSVVKEMEATDQEDTLLHTVQAAVVQMQHQTTTTTLVDRVLQD